MEKTIEQSTRLANFLKEASAEELRAVYNKVLMKDTMGEISSVFEGFRLTDLQIKYAAYLYVYEDEYDCEASYWDNLQCVVDMSLEMSDEEITQYFNEKEEH